MKKQTLTRIAFTALLVGFIFGMTPMAQATEHKTPNAEMQCMCMDHSDKADASMHQQHQKDATVKSVQKNKNRNRTLPRAKRIGKM